MVIPDAKSALYSGEHDSHVQNQISDSVSQIPQDSLHLSRPTVPSQVRPVGHSPQNSVQQNPHNSGMNRPTKPRDIPPSSSRPANINGNLQNGHPSSTNSTNSIRSQEHESYFQNQKSDSVSHIPKVSKESLNMHQSRPTVPIQVRPGTRSPQINVGPKSHNSQPMGIPPNSGRPGNINSNLQNGHRSPAPVRPARMNRPTQPGGIPFSSGRPNSGGIPPTNRGAYTRMASPNVGPAVARPYRPKNPSSSRVPDDI